MRVAILRTWQGEELCLVRNLSPGGLQARIWSDLGVGDALTTEFKSGQRMRGKVVWREGAHIGIQFSDPIDVEAILRDEADRSTRFRPRLPRVHVDVPSRVRVGARSYDVVLRDISQGGAKVQLTPSEQFAEGEKRVRLTPFGFLSIDGNLRWRNQEFAGITFNTPLSLALLGSWIAALRR